MNNAPADDPEAAFESGPLIMELFSQAKRLLALQPRMENRQLRKDNTRHQHRRPELFPPRARPHSPTDASKALDLLLPLSMDDIRTGSMPIHRHIPHVKKAPVQVGHTPLLMNGSPHDVSNMREQQDELWSAAARIKTEPCDGISQVQVLKQETDKALAKDSPMDLERHEPAAPVRRSNLTSSLRQSNDMDIDPPTTAKPGMLPAKSAKPTECTNCHTLKTPLWRKDRDGNTLCNACGLFLKLHGTTRPLSLKTDVIRKRSSRRASATPHRTPATPVVLSPMLMPPAEPRYVGSGSLPIRGPVALGSGSSVMGSYGSAPYYNIGTDGTPRPKNVLILPKPSGLGPGSLVSAPSSPYSASLQFKRKKSEVGLADAAESFGIRRTPSLLSTSGTANTPVVKRGFGSTPSNRRASKVNISRMSSYVGTPPYSGSYQNIPNSAQNSFQNSQSFQNSFQNQNSYSSFNNMRFATTPNATYFDQTFDRKASFDQSVPPSDDALTYSQSPSSLSVGRPIGGTRSSFVVPSDLDPPLNDSGLATPIHASDLASASFMRSAYPASGKNEGDIDADATDFFKNYTSLHNDTDVNTPATTPLDNTADSSGVGLDHSVMGNRYEIKPNTAIKSSLTDGLKGRTPLINAYNDSNDTRDLDWLKFEI